MGCLELPKGINGKVCRLQSSDGTGIVADVGGLCIQQGWQVCYTPQVLIRTTTSVKTVWDGSRRLLVGWMKLLLRPSVVFFSRIAARKKANLKMNYIISGKSKWRDKIVSNEWKRLKQLISRHTGSYVVYTPCACVFVIPVIEFPWQHHFNLMILYENLHETAILCESKNN